MPDRNPTPSHSYNPFIRRQSPRFFSISSSPISSVGKTSPGCRAENRTWACITARQSPTDWATPHSSELRRILLSYAAFFWATPHSSELLHTLLSYAASHWAKPHPAELRCTSQSYAACSRFVSLNSTPEKIIADPFKITNQLSKVFCIGKNVILTPIFWA